MEVLILFANCIFDRCSERLEKLHDLLRVVRYLKNNWYLGGVLRGLGSAPAGGLRLFRGKAESYWCDSM